MSSNKHIEYISFPEKCLGKWIDSNGKYLIIEPQGFEIKVSIKDKNNNYFKISVLSAIFLKRLNSKTKKLSSNYSYDYKNIQCLIVEAGIIGAGPTYNLYFCAKDERGNLRLANQKDEKENIIIRPRIGMGLYDDWEDDLGVPWAFPLSDFKPIL